MRDVNRNYELISIALLIYRSISDRVDYCYSRPPVAPCGAVIIGLVDSTYLPTRALLCAVSPSGSVVSRRSRRRVISRVFFSHALSSLEISAVSSLALSLMYLSNV